MNNERIASIYALAMAIIITIALMCFLLHTKPEPNPEPEPLEDLGETSPAINGLIKYDFIFNK
jgi:energy-converting hydrogenase Eha subunit F